jgi:hypothetical protein
MTDKICPKCGADSGDDWSQCYKQCPMVMSPYYDPTWRQKIVEQAQATLAACNTEARTAVKKLGAAKLHPKIRTERDNKGE